MSRNKIAFTVLPVSIASLVKGIAREAEINPDEVPPQIVAGAITELAASGRSNLPIDPDAIIRAFGEVARINRYMFGDPAGEPNMVKPPLSRLSIPEMPDRPKRQEQQQMISPAQQAAWRQLWDWLLAPPTEEERVRLGL